MNKSNSIHFPYVNHESRDANIRTFSHRIGEQTGQLLIEFLEGILVPLLDGKASDQVHSQVIADPSEKLLTACEVAKHLNISKAKAYQLMSTGKIPSVQFDRTTRVRKKDLVKFIDEHVVYAKL